MSVMMMVIESVAKADPTSDRRTEFRAALDSVVRADLTMDSDTALDMEPAMAFMTPCHLALGGTFRLPETEAMRRAVRGKMKLSLAGLAKRTVCAALL